MASHSMPPSAGTSSRADVRIRESAMIRLRTAVASLFIVATFLVVWLADRYLDLGRVFLQH